MTPAPNTRHVLAGALAASLLLAAPLAASAAEPVSVSSALYDGAQIPSTNADLKRTATVADGVILYSEPASTGDSLSHTLRGAKVAGGAEGRPRVSEPFTAHGEQWVAVQVPEAAYGTDAAKSILAEAGVAYVRAGSVTHFQVLGEAAHSYPRSKADLVTTAYVAASVDLYKHPVASQQDLLPFSTDKWGESLKSSAVFEYNGRRWVAVEVKESLAQGGVAYILANEKFMTLPTAGATASAAPTAGQVQAGTADPTAPAAAPDVPEMAPRLAGPEPDAFTKFLGKIPAVLFGALVMSGTLFILKRGIA